MAALITLQQAKDHLHITDEASNTDLELKVDEASAIIVRYLKSQAVAGWSTGAVPVPGNITAAAKLMVADLYEQRPIDWTAIERLLVSYRDPSLA